MHPRLHILSANNKNGTSGSAKDEDVRPGLTFVIESPEAAIRSLASTPDGVLSAEIQNMHIRAGIDVVEQVPADVIGIGVDDKVIATVRAPRVKDGPVPGGYLEVIAARELKSMVDPIHPEYVVTMLSAAMVKVPVVEGMV